MSGRQSNATDQAVRMAQRLAKERGGAVKSKDITRAAARYGVAISTVYRALKRALQFDAKPLN